MLIKTWLFKVSVYQNIFNIIEYYKEDLEKPGLFKRFWVRGINISNNFICFLDSIYEGQIFC